MDDLLGKMLRKRSKPMLTITVDQADPEGEMAAKMEEQKPQDLAPEREEEMAEGEYGDEITDLESILGNDQDPEKMPNRPMNIDELARQKMKKRLALIKK